MNHEIIITFEGDYIHVKVLGISSLEGTQELWNKIVQACEQHQCYNILGEQKLARGITTAQALEYPKIFKQAGVSKLHRIAWVDEDTRAFETIEFISNFLANRAIGKGKVFNNLEKAKAWLLAKN